MTAQPRQDDLATLPESGRADQGEAGEAGEPAAESGRAALDASTSGSASASASQTLQGRPTPRAGHHGLSRGQLLGRYVILGTLGAGAMGRVYAAYDPKLDRKIALKVLRLDPTMGELWNRAERRLLREAQALARLRHRNVVSVHDVESTAEGLAVSMDYIEGTTLRRWRDDAPRTWADIVGVMRGAAEGLAAAHRAGLVHRDFKPDNVMIDSDGMAHVVDFGLARAFEPGMSTADSMSADASLSSGGASRSGPGDVIDTRTHALAGTPAYMAPEQHRGQPAGPAADQFAYCVTLYEALFDRRPFMAEDLSSLTHLVLTGEPEAPPRGVDVPRHIRDAVMRGLATRPADRHPSMDALVRELDRDPAAQRRRWLALGGAAVAVAGGLSWAWLSRGPGPCERSEARVAESWDDDRRDEVERAMTDNDLPYARDTAADVIERIDEFATQWVTSHRDACEATHVRGSQSEHLLDLRTACLERQRQRLDATVEVLLDADAGVVERAIGLVATLPRPTRCDDVSALLEAVPPPQDAKVRERVDELRGLIVKAQALRGAGRYQAALIQLQGEEAAIEETGYLPLLAEYRYLHAALIDDTGDAEKAVELMAQAAWTAQRGKHDRAVARAMVSMVYILGTHLDRSEDALAWAQHASAAVDRMGDEALAADLQRQRGLVFDDAGRYEEALAATEDALRLYESLRDGPDEDVAATRAAYASVLHSLGRDQESVEHYTRALHTFESVLGPQHPKVGAVMANLGLRYAELGEPQKALESLRRALEIITAVHGNEHPNVAAVWANLAATHYALDDIPATMRALEESLAIWRKTLGPDHPDVALALGNLGGLHSQMERYDEAEEYYREAIDIRAKRQGKDHPKVGSDLVDLGIVVRNAGRADEATEIHERALRILEAKLPEEHLEIGRVRVNLATDARLAGNWEATEFNARIALRLYEAKPEQFPQIRGKARFLLAEARWALGNRETDAVAAVQLAAREVADDDDEAADWIEAWLRAHSPDARPAAGEPDDAEP